ALLNLISLSPTNRYWGIAGAQFKTPPDMYFEPAAFFMARWPIRPFEASACVWRGRVRNLRRRWESTQASPVRTPPRRWGRHCRGGHLVAWLAVAAVSGTHAGSPGHQTR